MKRLDECHDEKNISGQDGKQRTGSGGCCGRHVAGGFVKSLKELELSNEQASLWLCLKMASDV